MDLVNHAMSVGYSGRRDDIIHAFKAGSDLHGARIEGKSDLDVAGVFIEAPVLNLGIDKREHFITSTADNGVKNTTDDKDAAFHSLRHWACLAAGGNPTIIAYAFAPIDSQLADSVWAQDVVPNVEHFIAKKHTNAFLGYAINQLKRLQGKLGAGKHGQRPELEALYGYDTKMAMHMIRLLQEGIELMKTGRLTFPRPEKDLLLQIRKGEWTLERVEQYFAELDAELRATELASPLPKNIDRAKVSSIISNAYLSHWRSQGLLPF